MSWRLRHCASAFTAVARRCRVELHRPDAEAVGARISVIYSPGEAAQHNESWQARRDWQRAVDARLRLRLQVGAWKTDESRRRLPRRSRALSLVAATILVFTSAAFAAGNLTRLGQPTNDVLQTTAPLYGFRSGAPVLRSAGKVELLLYDADWDPASAVDRWSVVKALSQFGTWSGLRQGASEFTQPAFRGA